MFLGKWHETLTAVKLLLGSPLALQEAGGVQLPAARFSSPLLSTLQRVRAAAPLPQKSASCVTMLLPAWLTGSLLLHSHALACCRNGGGCCCPTHSMHFMLARPTPAQPLPIVTNSKTLPTPVGLPLN